MFIQIISIHLISVGFLINDLQLRHRSVYVISYNISVYIYENDKKNFKFVVANKAAFQS